MYSVNFKSETEVDLDLVIMAMSKSCEGRAREHAGLGIIAIRLCNFLPFYHWKTCYRSFF